MNNAKTARAHAEATAAALRVSRLMRELEQAQQAYREAHARALEVERNEALRSARNARRHAEIYAGRVG